MVAVQSQSPNNQLNTQHAIRTSYTAMQAKPQLPLWRPRDGRNEAYLKWQDALTNFEHDCGIDVNAPCPTFSEVAELIPHYATQGLTNDNDREIYTLFQSARDEWISLNELQFDVIRHSLILEGVNLERDHRMLQTLMDSVIASRDNGTAWSMSLGALFCN